MTFWFVEKPLRGNGRSAAKVTGLVVLMAAIGYTGFNSYERNGLEFRKVIKNQSPLVSSLSKIDSVYEYFQIFHEWRIGTCQAPAEGMTFEQKPDACVEKTRPLLFMFGDSYSGMLYPVLQHCKRTAAYRSALHNSRTAMGHRSSTTPNG